MRCAPILRLVLVLSLTLGACQDTYEGRTWRQYDPLGTRAQALQRRLSGCYELIAWREHRPANPWISLPGVLEFTPPRHFTLTTVASNRVGAFRLEPQGTLELAEWSAVLPDSALIEWIEPAPDGPPNGGIQAGVELRHDTLVGRAQRLTDTPSENGAYAELIAKQMAACPGSRAVTPNER